MIYLLKSRKICAMKKILEVVRYGDNDIRFRTDMDPLKNPDSISQTISEVAFAMMTTLWGGNEQSVLAMIRALAIADLGVSVNRKEMIAFLDDSSAILAKTFRSARKAFEKSGGKMQIFGPGISPGKTRS